MGHGSIRELHHPWFDDLPGERGNRRDRRRFVRRNTNVLVEEIGSEVIGYLDARREDTALERELHRGRAPVARDYVAIGNPPHHGEVILCFRCVGKFDQPRPDDPPRKGRNRPRHRRWNANLLFEEIGSELIGYPNADGKEPANKRVLHNDPGLGAHRVLDLARGRPIARRVALRFRGIDEFHQSGPHDLPGERCLRGEVLDHDTDSVGVAPKHILGPHLTGKDSIGWDPEARCCIRATCDEFGSLEFPVPFDRGVRGCCGERDDISLLTGLDIGDHRRQTAENSGWTNGRFVSRAVRRCDLKRDIKTATLSKGEHGLL